MTDQAISVDLEPAPKIIVPPAAKTHSSASSYFFVETMRNQVKHRDAEFVIGYSRNIYAWVRNFRADNAAYLLILQFTSPDLGRTFWRTLQDLPELEEARSGTATNDTHKHTFPLYRLRARKLATLVSQLAAKSPYVNHVSIVKTLSDYMIM